MPRDLKCAAGAQLVGRTTTTQYKSPRRHTGRGQERKWGLGEWPVAGNDREGRWNRRPPELGEKQQHKAVSQGWGDPSFVTEKTVKRNED